MLFHKDWYIQTYILKYISLKLLLVKCFEVLILIAFNDEKAYTQY